jgi:hypothetical protein
MFVGIAFDAESSNYESAAADCQHTGLDGAQKAGSAPSATLVIDSLAFRFQSRRSRPDPDNANPYTTVLHPVEGLSVPPLKLAYRTIEVRPILHCLTYTNFFDVVVSYRLCTEIVGEMQSFIGEGWFAIIKPAPQLFGRVFISYKEPEDRSLADLLFQFAKDAGFDPYMAPADLKRGSRIWAKRYLLQRDFHGSAALRRR